MRADCEPATPAIAQAEIPAAAIGQFSPAVVAPQTSSGSSTAASLLLSFDSLAGAPGDPGLNVSLLETLGRGKFVHSMAASCLIHAAVVLYTASTLVGWQVFVSEVGRNSPAKISRKGNNAPPKKVEVVLKAVVPPVGTEHMKPLTPVEVDKPLETVSADKKQQVATAPQVLAREDDLPAEVERTEPKPTPQESKSVASEKPPDAVVRPRLEQSELEQPMKREKQPDSAAAVASDGSEPSRGADVDHPPRPARNLAPEYPLAALKARQEGRVSLRVRVSAEGLVLKARILRTSGVVVLDEAALKAVKSWKFEPARRDGVPTEEEIAVPVKFVIAETKSPK